MIQLILKRWKLVVVFVVIIDMMIIGGILYVFSVQENQRIAAAKAAVPSPTPTATPTATATPWPGPGKRVTPTPTSPPTPLATDVLASSGFPPGFTPTPRPTRDAVMITLPRILPVFRSNLNVPVINQVYYPEPFFPPGTNNACGPVALYAALQGLGSTIEYSRLRDVAVSYGFTYYGISKSGMVGTIATLNQESGDRLVIEHGNQYNTSDLISHVRTGGIPIVLLYVRRDGHQFKVASGPSSGFGHFLIVDSINMRSKTVRFAGSTLGMEQVPLQDFIQSWSQSAQRVDNSNPAWQGFLKKEPANNWALVIRRKGFGQP